MLTRRACLQSVGAASLLYAVGGCAEGSDPTLNIAVFSQAVDYGPLYVAQNFGWLRSSELTAEVHEHSTAASITAALANSVEDLIFAAEPPIILARGSGVDLKIAGVSCTLRQEIVVRTDLNISAISGLENRRVAVLQGTSSHYGLLNALRSAGVEARIAYMTPPQAEAAFRARQIDAWAVWPPFVEKLEREGLATVLAGGDAIIQSVYAATSTALTQKRPAVIALHRAIQRAKEWMSRHPEEAQLIIASRLHLDHAIIAAAWPKHDWTAQINQTLRDDIASKVRFLRSAQLLQSDWSQSDIDALFTENLQ